MLHYREAAGICARQQKSRENNMYIRKISGILFSSLILAALLSGMMVFDSPRPAEAASKATISGLVWEDTNQNGIQDADEDGIRGVKVKLYRDSGTYVKAATTKGSGLYVIKNISPGDYYLRFILPKRSVVKSVKQGTDVAVEICVDGTTDETALITLDPGEREQTSDVSIASPSTRPSSSVGVAVGLSGNQKKIGEGGYALLGSLHGGTTGQNGGEVCPPGHSQGKKTGWDDTDGHPGSSDGGSTGQGNGQGNSQGNSQGNGQGNAQSSGQGSGQGDGQGNSQGNGQGNAQSSGQGNGQGNAQSNGKGN